MAETTAQPPPSALSSPKTFFVEFGEASKGKEFIEALGAKQTIGVFSISAPTSKGGCRVAVQVESSQVDSATTVAEGLGGKVGTVRVPPRSVPKESTGPSENDGQEGSAEDMAAKKKTSKKTAAKKEPSARFAKKTACKAPGHGEYGDIDSHNKKHHNGKAYVEKASGK